MAAVRSLARLFDSATRALAMLALFAMVIVTAVDVVGRTFFDSPLGFTFELAGVLLGIAIYAGLFGSNWRRSHVKIDLFAGAFANAPALERLRSRFSWVLEVAFFAIIAGVVLRQSATVARWNERYFFLPVEKWVPMAVFFGFLCAAVAVFALHLVRVEPDESDEAEI